jgi:hypothetical protein
MSEALDKVQKALTDLAADAKSADAIKIVDTLSKALATAQQDLLYERMPSEDNLPSDGEVTAFKKQVYDQLHKERVTDLFIAYDSKYFAKLKPITRLSIVQVLIVIAGEQTQPVIPYWQAILDSRGHKA